MTVTVRRARDGAIEFSRDIDGNGFFYDIQESYQQGENRINFWLDHLSRKNWFTEQVRDQFIDVWTNR